ncbi:MAG TPA: PAS domain-containing protein [Opitutales bacterium]|nr:PAS domain-containing protein [Opitutales bacterium]
MQHQHKFETDLVNEAATASGDRLPFGALVIERRKLLEQQYIDSSDRAPNPIFFFNQHRQLLHANRAALTDIVRQSIEDAIGLRLGELLGCEHRMSAKPGEVYACLDCNSMPSLRTALAGRHSTETRFLIIHPEDRPIRASFRVSAVPISAGEMTLAMLILEKVTETESL